MNDSNSDLQSNQSSNILANILEMLRSDEWRFFPFRVRIRRARANSIDDENILIGVITS